MLRAVVLPLLVVAQTALDGVAAGVLDDRVHVDPAAAVPVDEERVRDAIVRSGESVFVAVVRPDGATSAALAATLAEQVRIDGTYVVLAGDDLGAVSNVLEDGAAAEIAAGARASTAPGDVTALLVEVVRRVDRTAAMSGRSTDPAGERGPPWLLLGLPVAFLVAVLWRAALRQRDGVTRRARDDGDRRRLRAEVAALQADVRTLEEVVLAHPAARADVDAAAVRVRAARDALGEDGQDAVRVRRVVEEARYAIQRARARVDGRPPPAPPSALTRPGSHGEPAVQLGPRGEPVYADGGGPFHAEAGAWFVDAAPGGGLRLGRVLGDWGGRVS